MKQYIGIDLGGTHMRVAIVSEDGNILKEAKITSEADMGPDHVMQRMISLIHDVKQGFDVSGIGIGFPGPIDAQTNEIIMSTNLRGFGHYPAVKMLEEEFNLPVYIDNDANVAGLAEAMVGAGKGMHTVYYVTLSTGIGGGLIVGGNTVSGKHGHAGEIANIIIDRNRKKINHLNTGAVENEASGTAIVRKGKEAFGDQIEHAGHVFQLAEEGNEKALQIVDEMCYDLAMMFSAIAHVVDPEAFIVGGGMMKSKNAFFDKTIAYYKDLIHPAMRDVKFLEAELPEPGIIGAAMLPISKGN